LHGGCGEVSTKLAKEYDFMAGVVTAVSRGAEHTFSKPTQGSIRLLVGLGVDGDSHMGVTVKHARG
jgi:hypothetical protein